MPNQIMTIRPYRWNGLWVFDDESVGLHREPFVAGADTIIDAAVARLDIPNADQGFLALFSAEKFPGHNLELTWTRSEDGGRSNYYHDPAANLEGWLCPALLKYFPQPPKKIYAQLRPLPAGSL
jgi:hypothetical protein